jgi:2',3'-cyclic-nucleotide 2'-phosphodiesterase (5'-nucleotidase family)
MRLTCGRTVLLLATALFFWSPSVAAQEAVDLIVLHLNDTHGSLAPLLTEDSTEYGGAARAATLIRDIQRQNPGRVLVLHAGDLFSRGNPVSSFSGGAANLEILERMGVAALTPRNGDFYFRVENLVEQTSELRFPVLHGNVVHKATGAPLFPAYTMKEIEGVRVAILGLGTLRMWHYSARDLDLLDQVEVARQYAPILRENADILIVLSHLGLAADRALAAAIPEIDLIVGGHDHFRLDSLLRVPRPPNPVPIGIAQALHRYVLIGRVDVRMRRTEDGYAVDRLDGRLLPVTAEVPNDPDVEAILTEHAQAMNEVVGTLESAVVSAREGPSPLGELAAAAVRSVTGSDVAMIRRGNVQTFLESGPVTLADIARVHSGRVPILTARVKGSKIGDLGRIPGHLFSGCEVEDSTVVRIDGDPVDTSAFYLLSAPASAFTSVESLMDISTFRTGYRIDTAIERYLRLKEAVQRN